MQGQKTASSFDPKTLQVEVHNKQRQIEETSIKIAQAKERYQKNILDLEEQKRTLAEVTQKLEKFYANSKNPAQIDWSLFDLELRALENSLQNFYLILDGNKTKEEILSAAQGFKTAFEKFKQIAAKTSKNPQHNLGLFQKELEQAMLSKDQAQKAVQVLELEISKTKVQVEFLEKELSRTEQEKLHFDLELKKISSVNVDEYWQSLLEQEKRIQTEVEEIGLQVKNAEQSLKAFYDSEEQKNKQFREIESSLHVHQAELSKIKDFETAVQIDKAKYDTQMQILVDEVCRILEPQVLEEFTKQEIVAVTPELEQKIVRLKNQLDMIGGMDDLTVKEYEETESRYGNLSNQVGDLKKSMEDLRTIMDELDEHIKTKFNESFHKINEKFESYFRVLFNGGRAYLSLLKQEEQAEQELDSENEADENAEQNSLRPEEKIVKKYEHGASNIIGVDIKATPPGKKLANIQALSGGERSLTAIALLCALLTCFPSPFVVLDEVDAALDDANTIRFAQILGTLAHQTQFITITHNRETMSQSSMLYGVTMGEDGVSKLLSVKLEQAKAFAK